MSPLLLFGLFVQAGLIQSVLSQSCGYPNYSQNQLAGQNSASNPIPCSSYGGVGTGQVGVSGDINASGQTVVVGSVPVLGSVDFSRNVPASGSVSISAQCGCGCS